MDRYTRIKMDHEKHRELLKTLAKTFFQSEDDERFPAHSKDIVNYTNAEEHSFNPWLLRKTADFETQG